MERLVLNTMQRADKGKYISNLLCAQPSRPLRCMHVVWSIAAACDKQLMQPKYLDMDSRYRKCAQD